MLADILTNRTAVQLLKQLAENEINKRAYTTPLDELQLQFQEKTNEALRILHTHDLLLMEEDAVAITEKGKQFILHIDALKDILTHGFQKKTMRVVYDLSEKERKILFLLSKMEKEEDPPISLRNLAQELYPYTDCTTKLSMLSKYILSLEQMHLIERERMGKEVFLTLTDVGKRVIKEQIEQVE